MGTKFDKNLQKVYELLKDYADEHGYPPSVREICKALDVKSTASVYSYLEALQNNGLISKSKSKKRAIEIVGSNYISRSKIIEAPLVGRVACGEPRLALEDVEDTYPLPSEMFGSNEMFLLTASGDSMVEAGINSGDRSVVKKQNTAENGDIVVALLENECTVKRLYKNVDHCILHPENINMKDIIVYDNIDILGVVIGLIRKF